MARIWYFLLRSLGSVLSLLEAMATVISVSESELVPGTPADFWDNMAEWQMNTELCQYRKETYLLQKNESHCPFKCTILAFISQKNNNLNYKITPMYSTCTVRHAKNKEIFAKKL